MTNDKDSAVLLPCPTEGCESGKIEVGYLFGVYYVECDACGGQGDLAWNERNAVENWNHRPALRQPTQSDALLDAEGVKLYWYRQGKDDGIEHERAKIVAWLRDGFVRDWGQLWRDQLINAIEAGEHLISALDTLKDAEVCDDKCGPCNEAYAALQEQSK